MTVSKHQILTSLAMIEREAPLFFGDMPVADDVVRDLFASSMAALSDSLDFQRASPQRRQVSLLATLTHALLETAALRHQLRQHEQDACGVADHLIAKFATG